MKKFSIVMFLLIIVTASLLAFDNPVVVGINWHGYYKPATKQKANDFHIYGIIQSAKKVKPKLDQHDQYVVWPNKNVPYWYLEEYSIEKVSGRNNNWFFTAHFKTDGYINPGTMMHFGMLWITNYCNVIVVNAAYFTRDGINVGSVPLSSFFIFRRGGNNVIILPNTNQMPIIQRDLEFAIIREPIPLAMMNTEGLGNPGERGSKEFARIQWRRAHRLAAQDQIKIPAGGQAEFMLEEIIDKNMEPGQILLFRGNMVMDNGMVIPWWGQHEEDNHELNIDDISEQEQPLQQK